MEDQAQAKTILTELCADEVARVNLENRWGVAYSSSWTNQPGKGEEESEELKKTRTLLQWSVPSQYCSTHTESNKPFSEQQVGL